MNLSCHPPVFLSILFYALALTHCNHLEPAMRATNVTQEVSHHSGICCGPTGCRRTSDQQDRDARRRGKEKVSVCVRAAKWPFLPLKRAMKSWVRRQLISLYWIMFHRYWSEADITKNKRPKVSVKTRNQVSESSEICVSVLKARI